VNVTGTTDVEVPVCGAPAGVPVAGRGAWQLFIADSGLNRVRVRSPKAAELRPVLEWHGGTVTQTAPTELEVRGMAADMVGEVAYQAGVPLLDLSPQAAPLAMEWTKLR
jgi:ABC-2 type transport system ATP-binding protein